MSFGVNILLLFGTTLYAYITTVYGLSIPEKPLDSTHVHPRPSLTIPRPRLRT